MMKIIFMLIFMNLMLFNKIFISFYYNMLFLISFFMVFNFNDSYMVYSMIFNKYLGVDNYSYFMLILSIWIISLMLMSLESCEKNLVMKMIMFYLLLMIFIGYFCSMNLMYFYFFFEVSLIPTFFLIIYWGVNMERLLASFYLIMYTLFISFPLLVYMFMLFSKVNSLSFVNLNNELSMEILSFIDYMMIFLAFFIKMPMYGFHVWLPKAHVEAPVYGSMVLAAILLKLGSYGLIRLMIMLMSSVKFYSWLIVSISMIGSLVISILCLTQIDMKSLVAYSSVVHMNFILMCMNSLMKLGFMGSYIMMIGHGLCSSGLFYLVNIYYMKTNSRIIFMNKGMMGLLPIYSLFWFILCSSNFSFPLSMNFIGELFMISAMISWMKMLMVFLMMICFFSSAYSLFLYSYIQHGLMSVMNKFNFILNKEIMIMIIHIYPMVMILLNMIIFY